MRPDPDPDSDRPGDWPRMSPLGLDGLLVSFGDSLSEPANRAALALRGAIDRADWPGVEETSTSLVSTYLRFDPFHPEAGALPALLSELAESRDWLSADLPDGRRLWRVPTVFGGDHGPQLGDVAGLVEMSEAQVIHEITARPLRVQTIGFAPGMPYLGALPEAFDIPRQSGLTPKVPVGALALAIRQMVLFPVSTPTGWRQVGLTALPLFRPESETPFALRPGDEVLFEATGAEAFERMRSEDADGGARAEALR